MKNVMNTRKSLGFRTIFNILGPLTNPAFAKTQILGVFDANLTITATNLFDNSSIQNFTFTLFNNAYNETFIVNTSTQNIYPFVSGVYNLTGSADGFFNVSYTNITIPQLDSSYVINFQEEGALAFFIRDIDTAELITGSNTTVTFNNATQELQFSTVTGVGSIIGLETGNSYDVVISNSLYERAFTGFTYLEDVEQYDFYLTPNGTDINFNIVSVEGEAISGALVQVETFVDGVPGLVQSSFTDVRGFTRFVLPVDKTYFVTVIADSYLPVEDILINFNDPNVRIVLQSTTGALEKTGAEGVRFSLSPSVTVLETNQTLNFSYSIFASNNNLESYSLGIYNGSSLITFADGSNSGGDTLNLSFFATSPLYDGSTITAVVKYKLVGEDEQTLTRSYSLTDKIVYTGSILELREWMQNNISDTDRFVIFVMAFFVVMIVSAIFIRGFANVLVSTLMSFIIGWLVGMNLFLLISIGSILILGMIAWSNEIR